MKKLAGLLVFLLLTVTGYAQDLCSELNFYFQQLTINCRSIAGKIIPAFKEYTTTKVIPGMMKGQCSGTIPYSNEFVKFYSANFSSPAAADSLFKYFQSGISSCLDNSGFLVLSQASMDEGDKMIRWGKTQSKQTQTIVLELKPGTKTGFLVTLELILSYL